MTNPEISRADLGLPDDFLGHVREVLDEAEAAFEKEYRDPVRDKLPVDPPTLLFQQVEKIADSWHAADIEERQRLSRTGEEAVRQWWSEFHSRYYRTE